MQHDTPTLKSCWDQSKNVIVSYDYPVGQHPEIWGRIQYFYGNSMDPIKVESKLRQYLEKPKPLKGEHFGFCFITNVTFYKTVQLKSNFLNSILSPPGAEELIISLGSWVYFISVQFHILQVSLFVDWT